MLGNLGLGETVVIGVVFMVVLYKSPELIKFVRDTFAPKLGEAIREAKTITVPITDAINEPVGKKE